MCTTFKNIQGKVDNIKNISVNIKYKIDETHEFWYFFFPPKRGKSIDFLGHRFLLKSSTRDCATGPAIQFRRGPIRWDAQRGEERVEEGRGRMDGRGRESRSLDRYRRNQGRPPTLLPVTELRHPLGVLFPRERARAIKFGKFVAVRKLANQSSSSADCSLSDAYSSNGWGFRPLESGCWGASEQTTRSCARSILRALRNRACSSVACRVLACRVYSACVSVYIRVWVVVDEVGAPASACSHW